MKQRLLCLTLAAAFTASVAVADAGQRHGGSSSGSSSGSSGSSSGSSGSSGGSTSGGSSGGGSSSSGGSYSSPPTRGSGGGAVPRHGGGDSGSRRGGSSGGSSSGTAGRGYDGSSSGSGAVARHPGRGDSSAGSGRDNAGASVPDYSRPRGDRPVHGYAVPRGNVVPPGRPGGDYNYYYISPYRWYYNPWAFGTFGLGYIYDPFWWGPGYGPYGYGYSGPGGYGYGYGYSGGGGGGQDDYQGALRIKVKPREAKVRVDGYFVGTVDDFDGNFQKLRLDDGPHKVELLLDGYNPLAFDVMIVEGETVTYKGKMRPR